MLDRFAALQLLRWGVDGIKASPIKPETQINMIMPLANILKQSGCEITIYCRVDRQGFGFVLPKGADKLCEFFTEYYADLFDSTITEDERKIIHMGIY